LASSMPKLKSLTLSGSPEICHQRHLELILRSLTNLEQLNIPPQYISSSDVLLVSHPSLKQLPALASPYSLVHLPSLTELSIFSETQCRGTIRRSQVPGLKSILCSFGAAQIAAQQVALDNLAGANIHTLCQLGDRSSLMIDSILQFESLRELTLGNTCVSSSNAQRILNGLPWLSSLEIHLHLERQHMSLDWMVHHRLTQLRMFIIESDLDPDQRVSFNFSENTVPFIKKMFIMFERTEAVHGDFTLRNLSSLESAIATVGLSGSVIVSGCPFLTEFNLHGPRLDSLVLGETQYLSQVHISDIFPKDSFAFELPTAFPLARFFYLTLLDKGSSPVFDEFLAALRNACAASPHRNNTLFMVNSDDGAYAL
jgi:hypothetical protein